MSFQVVFKPEVLYFEAEQLEQWKAGNRAECIDRYCRELEGSAGFGEFLVGRHFESLGYRWVHHDFDIFGTNAPRKYPESEEILKRFLVS